MVFHCTVGKDRTGFAAALLLSALGVDRDTIMQDYLLPNRLYRRSPSVEESGPAHVMDVLWQVQAAFDSMDQDHGGVSSYLAGPVGMKDDERAIERQEKRGLGQARLSSPRSRDRATASSRPVTPSLP